MTSGAGAGGGHLMDKQRLVPAVQELWNAWEIHFMILLSLSLQVFLFLFAGMRRRSSNWFLQTVLWLAYLSADSVAVFVLGHLAVHATEPGHELLAFWAPFVLVHLGGQDTITAFAKQDNDLWRRHLLNLVIQAGVAGYVVAKASWPDTRLRDATVIMFVCGCLKYGERVFCLFYGATDNLKDFSQNPFWLKPVGRDHMFGKDASTKWQRRMEDRIKDMRDTLHVMSRGSSSRPPTEVCQDARTIIEDIISVDAPLNKADNITVAAQDGGILPGMLEWLGSSKSSHNAYEYVGAVLEYGYRLLYSKDLIRFIPYMLSSVAKTFPPVLQTCIRTLMSLFLILVSTIATSTALVLFMSVHKQRDQIHTSSNRIDITVTYALLVGAIVLDASSAANLVIFLFYRSVVTCGCKKQLCSQELGQYSIIIGPTTVYTLPLLVFNALNCRNKPITKDHMSIKEFILDTLLASGRRNEWSIASTRGRLALEEWMERHKRNDNHDPVTTTRLKSFKGTIASSADFPTSMLVLHIATDICYHSGDTSNSADRQVVKKHKQISIQLSNYIMYLVFRCRVMLTTNSKIVHDTSRREILETLLPDYHTKGLIIGSTAWKKRVLFDLGNHKDDTLKLIDAINKQTESSEEQKVEIKDEESAGNDDDNSVADDHIKKLQMNTSTLNSPVLPRAVAVSHELIGIENEAERWKLIAKVWAETLYYIAPRCGGDFHYEHLSTGGEFVTHVLLLMYYLGPFLPPPS